MENNNIIEWLMQSKEPAIKYRMLTEFFDKSLEDDEVKIIKQSVLTSKNATRILSRLDERGLFPHKPEYYGNFTTFNYLTALAELGLTIKDHKIADIVDWILTPGSDKHEAFIQKEFQNEHAYLLDDSNIGGCRQVRFLTTLVRLGALDDDRVSHLIDVFIDKSKFDGGYLCKWKKSTHNGQDPKSCYSATVPALLLYSYLPSTYRDTSAYKSLLEYFVSRNMIYSKIEPNKIISDTRLAIYSHGLSDVLSILYAMCKLGFGSIPEMKPVWDIVYSKTMEDGKYSTDYLETKKAILMSPVGQTNEWITFYVTMAEKYKALFAK